MSPHEKLLLAVGGPVVLAVVIGWLFHWYVLDARSWWRELRGWWASLHRRVIDLPGPAKDLRDHRVGEYQDREVEGPGTRPLRVAGSSGWRGQFDSDSPQPHLDADEQDDRWADQLHAINAELHDDPAPLHLEPWQERAWWDDPDLVVWDARRQADRCWEILHVEFPRLRAELCGVSAA